MAETLHNSPPGIELLADKLEKPLLDNRSYRVIKLPNQLEALLIHDPDTDKASAAMDVNVGAFSDEDDMPGMAHAVEHALFMGTEKYPGENDYSSYLTRFGGHSNAFTASTSTNYYFELSASASASTPSTSTNSSKESLPIPKGQAPLYGGLDRFAQFFVQPLFDADTLDRELRAVDSENKKNLQSDAWRLQQLNKSLSSKKHPFSKFSTGNYKVLHDDPIARGVKIRDAFMGFYRKNYSANRMKLAVLGKESLDEQQEWVTELFSDVQDQDLPQNRWDMPAFGPDEVSTQIFAKPVMEQRKITLTFPYPDEENDYESLPSRYISHLVGHEGPGSILAYLKTKGWASTLSSGASPACPGTAFFSIDISLTEVGLEHYADVVNAVFQYITMLKEHAPERWISDEMSKLAEVEFKYRQKRPASSTTSTLSGFMQHHVVPRDQLLSAHSLIRKFDPEAINRGLAALTPDNFRFLLVSKNLPAEPDHKEQWYGTEYKYEKIPAKVMGMLEQTVKAPASERPSELHLPAKNEFVPQRLDVEKKEVSQPLLTPTLIRNEDNVRTWFKKDDRFWVPKANIQVFLRSPVAYVTPLVAMLGALYKELVDDSLNEYSYDASIAGLGYNVDQQGRGLNVAIGGYNDKMHVLLEKVLVSMRDLEFTQERFDIIKDRLDRAYKNVEFQDPFRMISSYSQGLIMNVVWQPDEMLAELDAITADDVRAHFPQLLRQMHIEVLAHGNVYKEDALRVTDLVQKTLRPKRLPPSQWPITRGLVLPPGSDFLYERPIKNPDNVNHCIDYILYIGSNLPRPTRARLLLLGQLINEPCFDQLRTKEQLGYVVFSMPIFIKGSAAFRVLIQSERDCEYLQTRIDNFLTGFAKTLEGMSEADFQEKKIGLINSRLEKLKTLEQETGRFWQHITSETLDFELLHHDAENLEPVTKADVLAFYNSYIVPSSPTRAKLSVHLIAKGTSAPAETDPTKQKEEIVTKLAGALGQLGAPVDESVIAEKLEKIDLNGADAQESITGVVAGLLKESGSMTDAQVDETLKASAPALASLLPKPQVAAEEVVVANGKDAAVNGEKKKTVLIENVKAFKASLTLSAAAQPVKALAEFEELEPKL